MCRVETVTLPPSSNQVITRQADQVGAVDPNGPRAIEFNRRYQVVAVVVATTELIRQALGTSASTTICHIEQRRDISRCFRADERI